MLWNENILDREFASRISSEFGTNTALNRNASFRGLLNGQLNNPMLNFPDQIPGFNLIAAPPIRSANGLQIHPGVENFVRFDTIGGVVTTTSQFPQYAVQFVDWFYDFTAPYGGGFQMVFGIEGLTFEWNEDRTEFFYTDYVLNNPDGLTPGQVLSQYTTRVQHPGFVDPIGSFRQWHPNTVAAFQLHYPFYWDSMRWQMPNMALTDDEQRTIRNIMIDVDTYVDEQVNNFIMGRRSLDTFDQFVNSVNAMGIQEVLDIYNRAFEAWRRR